MKLPLKEIKKMEENTSIDYINVKYMCSNDF